MGGRRDERSDRQGQDVFILAHRGVPLLTRSASCTFNYTATATHVAWCVAGKRVNEQ